MKRSKFSEEQIVAILREQEARPCEFSPPSEVTGPML